MARGVIKLAALAGLAKQAREYARKNPDSVSSTIGKVESAVGRKVGPKYADKVGKAGNAARSGLGIRPTPPATTPPTSTPVTGTATDGTVPPPSVPPTV
ncbi:antitoxin [Knoellia sp. CPCC 206435]|uniref:antitoxin n=1 Tax=Knoellia terrae TaxID=3404797 RepID=UPI003B4385B1